MRKRPERGTAHFSANIHLFIASNASVESPWYGFVPQCGYLSKKESFKNH